MSDSYGRDLDLNLLRVFAVVAEEGSITRAASRLYVTQPAVSASMRRLSDFVGTELFARQGRGVVLTRRGTELLAASRAHLAPLVAAALAAPVFDPRVSTALVRIGLSDMTESLLLPALLERLRDEAPSMQLVAVPVQFRTVEDALLSGRVDMAVSVADDLPRSILRQPMLARPEGHAFVCLYDSRHTRLARPFTERDYFAREHVIVSYAGDTRGVVEDTTGKTRRVRVAVSSIGHVADLVDGSPLLATIPPVFAAHLRKTRPHLRSAPLPFSLPPSPVELLWPRTTDDDALARYVRGLLLGLAHTLAPPAERASRRRPRR